MRSSRMGGKPPQPPWLAHQNFINMAQTSINIQPCKVTASERHNKREKALSYVRSDLSHLNEWHNSLNVHLTAYDAQLRKLIKQKTGRACQAKSHPLHEAVVVINQETTMEDIKNLAAAMHDRWGFHFVQLSVHKDEGSYKNGVWKPNLHAHMVFDKIDHETGKTIKTTGKDTAEMQDMCARFLGMERGKRGSKKEHLDALEYKVKAKEAEIEENKQKVQETLDKLAFAKGRVNYHKAQIEELRSEISGLSEQKNEVIKLVEQKEQLKKDVLSLECTEEETQRQLDVLNSEVFMKEKSRDILHGEVQELIQEREQAKQETAAARASLQELTHNKENVKTWRWAYNELLHIIQPVLDAITRLAHFNGRNGRFTAFEVVQINMALGKDDKREERAARYTRWAKEDEEKPFLYGDYRYQCAGEEMQKVAKNASAYLNSIKEGQSRGMGY